MRIMQICSGGDVNGAIVHCAMLSRELVRMGHEVTLLCRPHAWIGKELTPVGVEVVESSLNRWSLVELRRLIQTARRRRIDVIHTHMSRANALGVLMRLASGIPSVATAHNRHIQLHWPLNDFVIGSSAATTRFHRRYNFVPYRRSETVHYFIDPARARSTDRAARRRIRASLEIADRDVLVAQVGDVVPRKGLIDVIEALPQVLSAVPAVRLAVVGRAKNSDDYLAHCQQEAQRLGIAAAIRWTGHRHDVGDVLAAIDVFVLASHEESLPVSILEAMAAGLPVVATRVGGIPEMVADGVTGRVVPAGRPVILAKAIAELAADDSMRRRLGEEGRRRIDREFSPHAIAPKVVAVYEQVIRRRLRKSA
ncbi:MAG: glycosyltransferase family 4 protein [Pirellulales bacterium]